MIEQFLILQHQYTQSLSGPGNPLIEEGRRFFRSLPSAPEPLFIIVIKSAVQDQQDAFKFVSDDLLFAKSPEDLRVFTRQRDLPISLFPVIGQDRLCFLPA